jgi:microsomal dipeptidase-like Zn-dependent dipeptidase
MPFADLHCHPSFKTSLRRRDIADADSPFTMVDVQTGVIPVDELLGDPLDSQSSMAQLLDGGVNLVVAALYAMENAYVKSCLINIINKLSDDLSEELVVAINQEKVSYWELTQRELTHLINYQADAFPHGAAPYRYKLINTITDYNPNDPNTLHIILSVEGGHGFYGNKVVDAQTIEGILENLRFFKRPENPRLLFVTMVHHARNDLANHAFAVPSTWAGKGTNDRAIGGFNPAREAFQDGGWGEQFIREALRLENQRRILIDVKHLSFNARLAYYRIREEMLEQAGLPPQAIPVIASHIGVTGLSYNDVIYKNGRVVRWMREFPKDRSCWEVKYNRIESFREMFIESGVHVSFNPTSLNLYNEELDLIFASKGLIGLSLDARILGFGDPGTERLSKLDVVPSVKHHLDNNIATPPDDFPEDSLLPSLKHVRYFCNNLLHMIKIGRGMIGEEAWKHVCIGSDFDGLIVSVEYRNNRRTTASDMPKFREAVISTLPEVAEFTGIRLPPNAQTAQGIGRLLNGLFHQNVVDFLQTNYR